MKTYKEMVHSDGFSMKVRRRNFFVYRTTIEWDGWNYIPGYGRQRRSYTRHITTIGKLHTYLTHMWIRGRLKRAGAKVVKYDKAEDIFDVKLPDGLLKEMLPQLEMSDMSEAERDLAQLKSVEKQFKTKYSNYF